MASGRAVGDKCTVFYSVFSSCFGREAVRGTVQWDPELLPKK